MSTTENNVRVFSYGSNMHIARVRQRVPSASALVVGFVSGRCFAYHKRGIDGSAKADAFHTGDHSDRVWGVVLEISRKEKPWLDRHEFLGVGYDEETVDVCLNAGSTLSAHIYVARSDAIDPALQPYSWYHDFVIHGARQHNLPNEYIRFLREFDSIPDSDIDRHEENRRLIGG